jgi:CheY-like chemotaxis protein
VLYVDDEADIRQIAELALGLAKDLHVQVGASGEEAIQMARTRQPDLVLLDVMMPGLDGPGTLKRMRADDTTSHIPVIFVTAKAMPREVAMFLQMGAIGVIGKPFDPMQLGNQVLAFWSDYAAKAANHG